MPWKEEIYRAFFVTFGMFEILTNISYLILKNGMSLAIRQHGELPRGVSKKQIRVKVISMLIFGSIFFVVGLYSFKNRSVDHIAYLCALIPFCIYAITEGCYYKYWKTIGFSIVSLIVLFAFLIL
ncbi:hypothetical protein ACQPU1_03770 [Clostridium paraputrificum]|uniref:hypothetical protein n=1 Tax=Clostridium TaxID=1485 RepID=UPI003D32E13B